MQYKIHNKDNYKYCEVFSDEVFNNSPYFTFIHEELQREIFFYPYLKKDSTIVDAGCNVGSYTLPAIARGCNVVAFNPPTPGLQVFKENIKINNFQDKLKLFEIALYSKKGFVNPLLQNYVKSIEDVSMPIPNDKPIMSTEENYYYECDTLDNLYDGPVDFIKIDVEGAELEVLKGAENIIKKQKQKPIIMVENHVFKIRSIERDVYNLIMNEWGLKNTYSYKTKHYTDGVIRTVPHDYSDIDSDITNNHTHSIFYF